MRTLKQDRERKRKEYEADPEKFKKREIDKRNKPQGREKQMFYSARNRAKKKGLEFTLNLEDIVIPEICPVFNVPFTPLYGKGAQPYSPSLDRIDNSKGYTQDNIAIISWRANSLKGDSNLFELKKLVKYLENISG